MDFPKKIRSVDTNQEVLECKKVIYTTFRDLHLSQMRELRRIEVSKHDKTNLLVVFRSEGASMLNFLIPVKDSDKAYERLKISFEGTPEKKLTFFV